MPPGQLLRWCVARLAEAGQQVHPAVTGHRHLPALRAILAVSAPAMAEKLQSLTVHGMTIAVSQLTWVLPPLARMLTLARVPSRVVRLPRLRPTGQP